MTLETYSFVLSSIIIFNASWVTGPKISTFGWRILESTFETSRGFSTIFFNWTGDWVGKLNNAAGTFFNRGLTWDGISVVCFLKQWLILKIVWNVFKLGCRDLDAKYLFFVFSHSVKARELSFAQFVYRGFLPYATFAPGKIRISQKSH